MHLSQSAPSLTATSLDTTARGAGCIAAYSVLCALTLSPLLWARVPPLVDYPNHLARMWILAHGTEIPGLSSNYMIHWRVLPDLAMDLIVPLLSRIMPVEDAGRLFIALTMLILVGGTAALHRVLHGRIGFWPIWSLLFIYNAALFWGLLNCLFATGLYLFAFAGWIATRDVPAGRRILGFSIVASAIFLLHLFAFGLYALSVAAYELGIRLEGRRLPLRSFVSWLAVGLQFVPGLLLWRLSLEHGGPTLTAYGPLLRKLYALAAPVVFHSGAFPLDAVLWLAAALFFIFAAKRRCLKLAPEMKVPLSALIVAAVSMPHVASGSFLADIRIPVVLPFLIIASTRLEMPGRGVPLFAAAAFVALLVRVWAVSQSWADYDRWFAEFRAAAAVIEPGSRLAVVAEPIPREWRGLPGLPRAVTGVDEAVFHHLPALAVIDRAVFFPYIFTGWTTIEAAPRNQDISEPQGGPITPEELVASADPVQSKLLDTNPNIIGARPYWRDWPKTFDYVVWMNFNAAPKTRPMQLQRVATGSYFEIDRIIRP
jgi:hypothetical protein